MQIPSATRLPIFAPFISLYSTGMRSGAVLTGHTGSGSSQIAFPKTLVGLLVALFDDYGEYERWNSNAHTSGFGIRVPRTRQLAKMGYAGLVCPVDSGE